MMYLRNRLRALTLVSVVLTIGLVLYWAMSPPKTAKTLDWPSFTMTVKAWGTGFGPNNTPGSTIQKIDYNGPTNWRLEVLKYPGHEDFEGTWIAYDGKTLRSFDAEFDRLSEGPAPADGHFAPPEILRRARSVLNGKSDWKKSIDQHGNTVLEYAEVLQNERGEQLTADTEITLDQATTIPVRLVDRVNGRVVKEITVENLTLK